MYHFFRATLIKIQSIKINHNLAQISYTVLLTKHMYLNNNKIIESKKSKIRWNRKRSLKINNRNCLPPGHGARHRQYPVRRLCNPPLKLNEKLLNVLKRRPFLEVLSEQFLWFLKNDLLQFHHIFSPFWQKQQIEFSDVLHEENFRVHLCPNMIHSDAVDNSERRSEEVISFFWCSV